MNNTVIDQLDRDRLLIPLPRMRRSSAQNCTGLQQPVNSGCPTVNPLTAEQQQFWSMLKGPEYHAHAMAKDMMAVRGRARRFHQRVDQHVMTVMHMYDNAQVAGIVKTWLTVYAMPIDATQLAVWDQFHKRVGPWVLEHHGDISTY